MTTRSLAPRVEREAEEFAGALLMDGREALEQRLVHPWEVAEYFGVPEELARKQLSQASNDAGETSTVFPARVDPIPS